MIDNRSLAARQSDCADLPEQQGDDGFRVRACRAAAATVVDEPRPLADLFAEDGRGELQALPHIGPVIARDLRLIGPRRRGALRAILAERLARQRRSRLSDTGAGHPPVDMLLKADEIYRTRAARGELPTIAPRRFNPEGRAWLPILHARHDDWHRTLLFSNTELAHRLGRTKDWVVVHAQKADRPEERCSIVTETRGELTGRRVLEGREAERLSHYQRPTAAAGPQIVSRQ